ncbi:MAG: hypothetical protein KAI24_01675 [Planctomycetes bacterium]|nr:hypothetical protein [Planctomycetota bacterium]
MTLRLAKLPLILAAFVSLFSPAVVAQEGGTDVPTKLQNERKKLAEKRDFEQAQLAEMTPEERLEATKRRGARGQCRFVTAMRPPKLLPGQTGTMLITAILQGRSVLPAPSQVKMSPVQGGGPVQLGSLIARPAERGRIHEGYLGRPVYENTAVFEVPVTMGEGAKLGDRANVAIELEFDIYDGRTAQVVGRFQERVTTQVEVGAHLDPPVEGRSASPSRPAETTPDVAEPTGDAIEPDGDAGREQPEALTGSASPVGEDVPEDDGGDATPGSSAGAGDLPLESAGEGGLPTMLLVGGGVFLLVIVLLLARKK